MSGVEMARALSRKSKNLPVGTVALQKRGDRTVLVVQETTEKVSVIESWEEALDLVARLLGRVSKALNEMNADLVESNRRSAAVRRKTKAKIAANQRLLDRLVKAHS